ncbi:hypothetical protein VNO80_25458 [Phaseolus coccineus]|uniref:Uncharacterized protein n=1 Tax=Phaseolus coccineus TaxID=3886 RepID=A0AAN9LZI5_PHACN
MCGGGGASWLGFRSSALVCWCGGGAGSLGLCSGALVRWCLSSVATVWVVREGVRRWWCCDCLSGARSNGGGTARDVASVGTLMAFTAFSEGQVFNMLRSAAKLSPIAHMREVNSPIARIFVDQLLAEVVQDSIVELEKAYDKLMMAQLTNRKKGVTFGSFKVDSPYGICRS